MKRALTLIEMVVCVSVLMVLALVAISGITIVKGKANTSACAGELHTIGMALQMYALDYDGSVPPIATTRFIDHHSRGPARWGELLQPYVKSATFPHCPSVQLPARMKAHAGIPPVCGYAYNGWLNSESIIPTVGRKNTTRYIGVSEVVLANPSLTVTVFDARAGMYARRSPDAGREVYGIWAADYLADIQAQPEGASRHDHGANYLFADGHVKWSRPENIGKNKTCDGAHPGFGL